MDTLTFSTILAALSTNLWVAVLAIFVYFLWKSAPKFYEMFEKHLKEKLDESSKITAALENNTRGMGEISKAIHSFEKAFLTLDHKVLGIKEEVMQVKDELKDELVYVRERLNTYPPYAGATSTAKATARKRIPSNPDYKKPNNDK